MEATASAHKHGVPIEDMQHALRHHLQAFPQDERGFRMFVGSSTTGELLEIGVVTRDDQALIVYAMPARIKFRPKDVRT